MSGTRQWTEAQTETRLSETLRKSTADGRANTKEELLKHGERDLHRIWTSFPSTVHFMASTRSRKELCAPTHTHIIHINMPDMLAKKSHSHTNAQDCTQM